MQNERCSQRLSDCFCNILSCLTANMFFFFRFYLMPTFKSGLAFFGLTAGIIAKSLRACQVEVEKNF